MGLAEEDLARNYRSGCDPRLNYAQALELAFRTAREMRALRVSPRGERLHAVIEAVAPAACERNPSGVHRVSATLGPLKGL